MLVHWYPLKAKWLGRMADALRDYIIEDRPFLGICLGLQVLFECSDEMGRGMKQRFFAL